MAKKLTLETAMAEVKELKELFEKIKTDSEEFLQRSKVLSESGFEEASALLDDTKETWEKLRASFAKSSLIGNLFGRLGTSKVVKSKDASARKLEGSKKNSPGKIPAGQKLSKKAPVKSLNKKK